MRRLEPVFGRHRPSAWAWLVTVSACLIVGSAIALATAWAASRERRVASYAVHGRLAGIALDVGGADVAILGGGDRPSVDVRRTDDFAFGRAAVATRSIAEGVLHLRSRCPATVFGSCAASYRLIVPDNVPVSVRTGSGDVRLDGVRGSVSIQTGAGDVAVDGYCGFSLSARAETGDVGTVATCAPERLELRSRTGDVRAVVPPGRYRVDADSDEGERDVRGVLAADDAPFEIQALSTTGDVEVTAAR